MKKVLCFLCMIFVSLLMVNSSFAELVPLKVGYTNWMADFYWDDEENEWAFNGFDFNMVNEKTTIDGKEYFREVRYDHEGEWILDGPWVRSTEDTTYFYTQEGIEYAAFTIINEGIGDFIDVQELDPGDPPGYLYIVCTNWDDLDPPSVTFDWGDTYDDVYHFQVYHCTSNSFDTCSSNFDEYEIAPGTGIIRSISEGGTVAQRLRFREPPKMSWFKLMQQEFEDSSVIHKAAFGLSYNRDLTWPGELSQAVPLDDFLNSPLIFELQQDGSLFDDLSVKGKTYSYRYGYGKFYGDGDSRNYFSDFIWEHEYVADISEPSPDNYTLVLTDSDGIDYIGEYTYNPHSVALPFIRAQTFRSSINTDGDFRLDWELDDTPPIPVDGFRRISLKAYNGESHIGLVYPKVYVNYLVMPVNYFPEEYNRLKIRAQVRYYDDEMDWRTYSNWVSVPLYDSDNDGIATDIDVDDDDSDGSIDYVAFDDGQTYGQITFRDDLILSVTNTANSEEGALLAAFNGTGTATVDICGGSATIELTAGDETIVTCGSAIINVIRGSVKALFTANDGSQAEVNIEGDTEEEGDTDTESKAENEITFDPQTFTFSTPETNTVPLQITLDDGTEVSLSSGEMMVNIDIKPGSDSNCVNINDKGVIPVAIFSNPTISFDATKIDPVSVELAGMQIKVVGKASKYLSHVDDVDDDGHDDLVVQIQDLDGTFLPGTTEATLIGKLFDGTDIVGKDMICIVP